MTIKYNPKGSTTTIKLSWTETRQLLSTSIAVEAIRQAIQEAIDIADSKQKVLHDNEG